MELASTIPWHLSTATRAVRGRLHKAQSKVLSLECEGEDKEILFSYLRLRKKVFVDHMGWELNHFSGCEFEQYDTNHSRYVVIYDPNGNVVLGGARLLPTTHTTMNGAGSYMIRDADLGLLDAIPSGICFDDPPVSESIWELTRIISYPTLNIGSRILLEVNRYLNSLDVKQCLCLSSPALMRMARSAGHSPVALGKITKNKDGNFLPFSCQVQAIN